MVRVLYLGMADDIMAPLLLVPDLDTLFAIDLFDDAYSPDKTFRGQKEEIKRIIIEGNDKNGHCRALFEKNAKRRHRRYLAVHSLKEKGEILSESDDDFVWRLKFKYLSKVRDIVFYYNRDFTLEWPKEIENIDAILDLGAVVEPLDPSAAISIEKKDLFIKMLQERTSPSFTHFTSRWDHDHYETKHVVFRGRERHGSHIVSHKIADKKTHRWYLQLCCQTRDDRLWFEDSDDE